jgi:hypothetical protein
MGQNDQYEIYLKRSAECDALAKSARDISIRHKCAELAVSYRDLASALRQRIEPATGGANVQSGEIRFPMRPAE